MPLLLTDDDMVALYKYFLQCGPISYEHHWEVHRIYNRIERAINAPKELKAKNRLLPLDSVDKEMSK